MRFLLYVIHFFYNQNKSVAKNDAATGSDDPVSLDCFCKKERAMVRSRVSGFKKRLGFVLIVPLLFLGMCQTYVFGGLAKVEKTGQIISYSATGGEDGDLKKGVKWPKPRFVDNGNGTVTDRLTKLIWLKNANAFGIRTWEQALSDANTLASGSAGLTDGSVAGD